MSITTVLELIEKEAVQFIDLRFTDTRGKEQHVSVPSHKDIGNLFETGKMFDGSSIAGWQSICNSDLVLMPDMATAFIDPFYNDKTMVLRCDIVEPTSQQGYHRDPRTVAKRAEVFLCDSGIADKAFFGPEPEFFILDDVRFDMNNQGAFYKIDSNEAAWNSGQSYELGNMGHRPGIKGGYFPVPPVDSSQDIRSAMTQVMQDLGMVVETHHHEVATCNQNEISTQFDSLLNKADELMLMKYIIHNVAHTHGKSATFMPKPIVGDNGSGMHCHMSLSKDGNNIFAGDQYEGLSMTALYFIGGIIKHAPALNAFTNPSTNSYKRLVPGFEAPDLLAYSARNRSAAIRIPYTNYEAGRRIEVRFPDAMANPYLAFSAMLMAGIDGIQREIHPGEAVDQNLYALSDEEKNKFPKVAGSLGEALAFLDKDREFLVNGEVFTHDMIDSYIALLNEDVTRYRAATHPIEFLMYYSL